jgi:Fis family transcriptional regulator
MNQEASAEVIKFEGHVTPLSKTTPEPLRLCVISALKHHFQQLDGHDTSDLYKLVISEVEAPLFESVLNHAGGNQTRAANILGISRSTLRKKLTLYGLDK